MTDTLEQTMTQQKSAVEFRAVTNQTEMPIKEENDYNNRTVIHKTEQWYIEQKSDT